jgi:AcrR family transcriptional regulator
MSIKKTMQKPHYATTRDARVIQSREALKQALLDLLKKKPFKTIKIREITDVAGVGYNTFFRHQSSKDDLLKDIAAGEIKSLIELSLAALGEVNTRQAARAVCDYVDANRALWSALLAAGAVDTLREEFIRLSWMEAESNRRMNEKFPTEVGILLVASGTIELLAWWLRQPEPIAAEELADIYEDLIVAPTIKAYQ